MPNRICMSIFGRSLAVRLVIVIFFLAPAQLAGQLSNPYALFRKPTISKTQIAFCYGGDLWIVDRNGGEARRLTSDVGIEIDPVFSPDGGIRPRALAQRAGPAT
jgi:tricorn protease